MAKHSQVHKAAASGGDPKLTASVFKAYQRMLVFLFFAAFAVITVLLSLLLGRDFLHSLGFASAPTDDGASIFLVVILAGTLGAFFSALLRLYEFRDLPKAVMSDHFKGRGSLALFIYSLVPALTGTIAAAVLYLIFSGELLQGSLFPKFTCQMGPDKCNSFALLITKWGPTTAVDYSKVLVWGFIAGFAERLVPNLLKNFAQSEEFNEAGQDEADREEDKQHPHGQPKPHHEKSVQAWPQKPGSEVVVAQFPAEVSAIVPHDQ